MDSCKALIEKFYTAFQKLDYATMNSCYSDEVVFSDPVFGLLHDDEVRAMWEMLCKNAKDFSLEFSNIQSVDEEYYTCNWTATYTFSKTGRKVTNNVKAFMKIKDARPDDPVGRGKIIEHSDGFRLSKWIAQAFGWKGLWLGWTGFMKRKVQAGARKNLEMFMQQGK